MKETKFKETEIGMIPEDWNIANLLNLTSKIGSGVTPKGGASVYINSGTTLVRSQNVYNGGFSKSGLVHIDEKIADKMKNVSLLKEDVLLNITGDSVARCCITPEEILPARVNQHVLIIRTKNDLNPSFLRYFLVKPSSQIRLISLADTGGTRKALTKNMVENLKIPLPPLLEQKAIAKILSDLDSKIELLQEQSKTLESIGKAIFKQWFVDFEFPDANGKPYKSSGGEMVESELGEIPKGWEVKKIIEVVKQLKPGTNFQPKRVKKGIPFVTVKNIQNNFLSLSGAKLITDKEYLRVHKNWQPEENDLLITRIGTLGNIAVIRKQDLPVAVHYNSINIKCKDFSFQFLFFFLNSEFFQRQYHLKKKQSVQEYVTIDEVETINLILPSDKIFFQNKEITFKLLFNKISVNFEEINNLQKTRDLLLPKLMSGKIRVHLGEKA